MFPVLGKGILSSKWLPVDWLTRQWNMILIFTIMIAYDIVLHHVRCLLNNGVRTFWDAIMLLSWHCQKSAYWHHERDQYYEHRIHFVDNFKCYDTWWWNTESSQWNHSSPSYFSLILTLSLTFNSHLITYSLLCCLLYMYRPSIRTCEPHHSKSWRHLRARWSYRDCRKGVELRCIYWYWSWCRCVFAQKKNEGLNHSASLLSHCILFIIPCILQTELFSALLHFISFVSISLHIISLTPFHV